MRVGLFTQIALCGVAAANSMPRQTPAPLITPVARAEDAESTSITKITSCHLHGSDLYCMAGVTEFHVQTTPTATTDLPASFTGCHNHGSDMYCIAPDGEEVFVENPDAAVEGDAGHDDHGHDHEGGAEGNSHQHCHFHAGVEHCVGGDEEESAPQCDARPRDYNVGLRVGLLFAVLATSALGVFGPIFLQKALPKNLNLIFIILKQFGTGIIISTAFVHLYTHASLMFGNKCLGELKYEGTTSAIVMAGLFLSFIIEYIGHRVVMAKAKSSSSLTAEEKAKSVLSTEVVSILVMEAGILFHSLLIGLTLVVAGDSFFLTLFIVIVFHQVFEGLALGSRIATVGTSTDEIYFHGHGAETDTGKGLNGSNNSGDEAMSPTVVPRLGLSMKKKLALASLFAFVTPIGMAIGIGVLNKFNGNDPSTIVAIGTLDALSAGILVWVGVVEMWSADWMTGMHGQKAELADASLVTVLLAGLGLVSGLVLMSVLGKWA
ncbi:high-affinity Zn(2+) transporter zrt1 [Lecanicillium sp. MT-2017a]|nr:high-affinity Zn(2+) transporter zrt1 [Lecanicillium sp. MT-2017a]